MILHFGNSFGHMQRLLIDGWVYQPHHHCQWFPDQGDIYYNPGLGYALAIGMVLVMVVMMSIYYILRRRSERWLRQ